MNFYEWKSKMESPIQNDRIEAVDELPDAEEEEVLPILINGLNDDEELVRIGIYESLGCFPVGEVRFELNKCLKRETNELLIGYAIEALGKVGEIEEFCVILNCLKNTESSRIKLYAVSGLVQGFHRVATHDFIELLEHPDNDIRSCVSNLTQQITINYASQMELMIENFKEKLERENKDNENKSIKDTLNLIKNELDALIKKMD
jgi:hypothetical protein